MNSLLKNIAIFSLSSGAGFLLITGLNFYIDHQHNQEIIAEEKQIEEEYYIYEKGKALKYVVDRTKAELKSQDEYKPKYMLVTFDNKYVMSIPLGKESEFRSFLYDKEYINVDNGKLNNKGTDYFMNMLKVVDFDMSIDEAKIETMTEEAIGKAMVYDEFYFAPKKLQDRVKEYWFRKMFNDFYEEFDDYEIARKLAYAYFGTGQKPTYLETVVNE